MTQRHTPDRIWAWYFLPEKQDDVMVGGWDDKPDHKEAEYLLATPAREAADELLEALVKARDYVPDHYVLSETIDAAIAKAKGETQ